MVEVGSNGVGGQGAVAHDEVIGLLLGDGGDGLVGDIFIKASCQEAVGDVEDLLAGDGGFFDFAGEQHTQIQHHLEQQILGGAVFLDVVGQGIEHRDFVVGGGVVHILHVGAVQLQHTEAGVQTLSGEGTFVLDLPASPADTLLADFTDVFLASFVCFRLTIGFFGQLDHDELAIATILCVQLHNSVSSGCRTREKV